MGKENGHHRGSSGGGGVPKEAAAMPHMHTTAQQGQFSATVGPVGTPYEVVGEGGCCGHVHVCAMAACARA